MSDTNFKRICKVSDLPNRRGRKFTIAEDTDIAVFRIADKVYAVSNVCPHNQAQVLYDGYVDEGLYLACPIHGWQFHLETGKVPAECKGLSATLETYNVKIENDEVWVEVKVKKKRWWQ
ncbi:MAG: nitrite reductase small subunit NirD [Ignavibacteria bacterium]|nr:nitrite reductase small subunit NirD [Ignavibacteria bacterium]